MSSPSDSPNGIEPYARLAMARALADALYDHGQDFDFEGLDAQRLQALCLVLRAKDMATLASELVGVLL